MQGERIVIRPGRKFPKLIDDLRRLAEDHNRSLNNYLILILSEHVKNQSKPRIQAVDMKT